MNNRGYQHTTRMMVRTVRFCEDCYKLEGEFCTNRECVFYEHRMDTVASILDSLRIRPIVNGAREFN